MHITDLEKVLLRSKEQNAVSKRNIAKQAGIVRTDVHKQCGTEKRDV